MLERRAILALLVLSLPAGAEWREVTLVFQPTGCTACVESLEARFGRVRGVATARLDAARNRVSLSLESGNRVRFERLRSVLEQDGTRLLHAEVEARGVSKKQEDRWMFYPLDEGPGYPLAGRTPAAEGPVTLKGVLRAEGRLEVSSLADP